MATVATTNILPHTKNLAIFSSHKWRPPAFLLQTVPLYISLKMPKVRKKIKDPKEVKRGTEEMDMQKLNYDSS
jgi:hypothetical protein